jgi:hypothetical protein
MAAISPPSGSKTLPTQEFLVHEQGTPHETEIYVVRRETGKE